MTQPLRDNSVRDSNTGRLIRIESKLTKLMLVLGLDEHGRQIVPLLLKTDVKEKLK